MLAVEIMMSLTTPSLLFPAISLLLLAYTNRFLGLASVVRALHASYKSSADPVYLKQIQNLRRRILLIRNMQFFGVLSILLCTICMFVLFVGWDMAGKVLFGASLTSMIASLVLSLVEIQMSVGALDHQLKDLEENCEDS
ncbi:MAG: DUF2721 domain-containing protein [Verrucomicrobium sp.]